MKKYLFLLTLLPTLALADYCPPVWLGLKLSGTSYGSSSQGVRCDYSGGLLQAQCKDEISDYNSQIDSHQCIKEIKASGKYKGQPVEHVSLVASISDFKPPQKNLVTDACPQTYLTSKLKNEEYEGMENQLTCRYQGKIGRKLCGPSQTEDACVFTSAPPNTWYKNSKVRTITLVVPTDSKKFAEVAYRMGSCTIIRSLDMLKSNGEPFFKILSPFVKWDQDSPGHWTSNDLSWAINNLEEFFNKKGLCAKVGMKTKDPYADYKINMDSFSKKIFIEPVRDNTYVAPPKIFKTKQE